jgi:hypothetical protein
MFAQQSGNPEGKRETWCSYEDNIKMFKETMI